MRTRANQNLKKIKKSKASPSEIETYLTDLEKATDAEIEFWDDYWQFLSKERERRLEDILDALHDAKLADGNFENCSRIVSAAFANDPLCTAGSTKVFDNRFNFGNIASSLNSFQALYAGENYATAFLEKFGHEQGTYLGVEGFNPSVLRAQPGDFSHFQLNIELDTYIDLRKIDRLKNFVAVTKDIEIPKSYLARAKKLFGKTSKLTIVATAVKLKQALLFKEHAQWPTLLNQPSNSQWFGHYVKEAGISGIVYPSVKNKYGYNVVMFTDNIHGSSSSAKLVTDWPTVPKDRQFLDTTNSHLMQFKPTKNIIN